MKHEPAIRSMFFDDARDVRNLLEDFEPIGLGEYAALIPRQLFDSSIRGNVAAALLASRLHLSSIDYTKKRYPPEEIDNSDLTEKMPVQKYIEAYMASKRHIKTMLAKASPSATVVSTAGSFGASIVLARLEYSFFSAHFLYQLGHQYEAHAVSRLILEQIAWAYAAYHLDSLDDIKKLITTRCITKLREVDPNCGKLYGELSSNVHLDFSNHREFLSFEDGVTSVLLAHSNFYDYARVILTLADLFGIVWELSQVDFIKDFESTRFVDGIHVINKDRPFIRIAQQHLAGLRTIGDEK